MHKYTECNIPLILVGEKIESTEKSPLCMNNGITPYDFSSSNKNCIEMMIVIASKKVITDSVVEMRKEENKYFCV